MEVYLVPIKSAFIAFPFIALLFTMPYLVTQYKKFGAIPFWRSAILYSFILYLINMYFFVILPLPPVEEVANYTGRSTMQLVPFQFVSDFITKSNFDLTNPSTYIGAFTDSSFFVVLFNILLFVPFGIYLRYYFKWGWKKTLAASFGVSLFFELTQLSGLYGIYPRPYRLFDVDDLMLNTLGGMSGYWITPIICHFLPSREQIDEMAYEKGDRVPLFRRFLALVLDWITLGICAGILRFLLHIIAVFLPLGAGVPLEHLFTGMSGYVLILLLYFIVLPWLSGGYTFGKWFFRMRLVAEDGGRPSLKQCAIRYGLLHGFVFNGPFLALGAVLLAAALPPMLMVFLALFVVYVGGVWLLFLWESLAQLFGRRADYFYGRLSETRNQNMIQRKKPAAAPESELERAECEPEKAECELEKADVPQGEARAEADEAAPTDAEQTGCGGLEMFEDLEGFGEGSGAFPGNSETAGSSQEKDGER